MTRFDKTDVLLVDDEKDILEQAKIYIEMIDDKLKVTTVNSAEKALKRIEKANFDVIISDYQMPIMDGLSFLESVRNDLDMDTPFIMFTGKGREEIAMKALNLGADRYLQKGGSPKSQYNVLVNAIKHEVNLTNGKKLEDIERKLTDSTGHKKGHLIRERLQDAVKNYRKIIEISPNAIILVDKETKDILDINRSAEKLLNTERENIIGKKYLKIHPRKERNTIKKVFKKDIDEKISLSQNFHVKSIDGSEIPVEIMSTNMKLNDKEIIYFSLNDLTEVNKAKMKHEFLQSLVRHDLKNKAQIVQGYLQLLELNYDLPEEALNYIHKAKKENQKSVNFIEKVKLLRRAEEENKEVEIRSIINEAISMCEDFSEEKGVKVNFDRPPNGCKVKGGSVLNEVFFNLIENAVYHSKCSKINISTKIIDDKVRCTIEDNGKGIFYKNKDKIFQKGYTTDTKRGTGLGLFLVKMLLESYDGKIEVDDSELGGARFDVFLNKVTPL